MSTVKQNNPMSWKKKLDEMESIPGETWNKDVAWEKLHIRVKKNPARKNLTYWFAAVAACLVLFIGIIGQKGNEGDIVNNRKLVNKPTNEVRPVQTTTATKSQTNTAQQGTALVKKQKKARNNIGKE